MLVGILIFVGVVAAFTYCVVAGAAMNRSPEYQKWLDDEQLQAIHDIRETHNGN